MSERQLQFRVGLLTIAAALIVAVMILQFGQLRQFWERRYPLAINFESAPGVYPGSPAKMNGLTIGSVRQVALDEKHGGVMVIVEINETFRIRKDSDPRLVRSLLGDTSIEFSAGNSREYLPSGAKLRGQTATDPMEVVNRLEQKVAVTVDSFRQTSQEWQNLARNMNSLLETNDGNIKQIVERAAVALAKFTETMSEANTMLVSANRVIGDPKNQQNLQATLEALPQLTNDTRKAISAIQSAISQAEISMRNVNDLTGPLAKRGTSIATSFETTLKNMESLSGELNDFTQLVTKGDGALTKLATDPELYRNLNNSASSLALLLKNLEPVMRDMAIFSDKIARHPELLGVSGAIRGSAGIKQAPPPQPPAQANRRSDPDIR